jgi:ATP-dependent protease HslVU (ClpYQ) peptidase subunit
MTAIVSTIYGKGRNNGHGCIIVADKMLSYRDIALETDSSKLHKLVESETLRVVMGAAGTAELIEDFSQRLQENIERINGNLKKEGIRTVRDIAKLSVKTINEMIKENIESFLIPYGKTLNLNSLYFT